MFDRRYHKIFRIILSALVLLLVIWCGRGLIQRISVSGLAPFVRAGHWLTFQIRRLETGGSRGASEKSIRWQLLEKERRMAELQTQLSLFQNLERENQELRRLLGLKIPQGWKAVTAEVILRDPVFWNLSFTINKGLKDQIPVGAVVLFQGQVLGRVVQNDRHLSVVAMLFSPDCRLGVRVGDSDYVGVCHGLSRNPDIRNDRIQVDYLPRDLQVPPDTVLYTSGLGGVLPAGLPVARAVAGPDGRVVRKLDQSRGYLHARLLQDIGRFQFVMVLVPDRK